MSQNLLEYSKYLEKNAIRSASSGNFECHFNRDLGDEEVLRRNFLSKFLEEDIRVVKTRGVHEYENLLRTYCDAAFNEIQQSMSHIHKRSGEFADKENILEQAQLTILRLFQNSLPQESKYSRKGDLINMQSWEQGLAKRKNDFELIKNDKSCNKTLLIVELEEIIKKLKELYAKLKSMSFSESGFKKLTLSWSDYPLESGKIDCLLDPYLLNWLASRNGQSLLSNLLVDITSMSQSGMELLHFDETSIPQRRWGSNDALILSLNDRKYGVIPCRQDLFEEVLSYILIK
jgi:hypothetical protein